MPHKLVDPVHDLLVTPGNKHSLITSSTKACYEYITADGSDTSVAQVVAKSTLEGKTASDLLR